jgi:hypothetical protein
VFTRAPHWSLFWTNWIHYTPLQPIFPSSTLILFSHLHLNLPSSLFPSVFPTKTTYGFFLLCPACTCPAQLIRLDLICLMIFRDEYKLWSSSPCNFLHSSVASSSLGQNILLRILFSKNTMSMFFPLCETKLHTNKRTPVTIMVLYILTFTFLDSRREDSEPNGSNHFLKLICS